MPGNHEQIAGGPNQALDPLDPVLDVALAKYATVEPRVGLEDRVLANLRTEPAPLTGRAWWRWGLSGALAAIAIVAMALAWRPGRSAHLPMANHPTTTEEIRRPANPPAAAASNRLVGNTPTRTSHSGSAVRKAAPRAQAVAQADPKLDVFPSPQPLSKEEVALAQYVLNFPTDAKQVAQAQAASEREVLAKMQALANESTESN